MKQKVLYSEIPFKINNIDITNPPQILFHFSLEDNNYNGEKFTIRIKDDIYRLLIAVFELELSTGPIFWVGPGTAQLKVTSGNILFEIYHKNNLVYAEKIKIFDEPDLSLLYLIPDILKYSGGKDVNLSVFGEVFGEKQYEYKNIQVEKGDVVVDIGANIGAFIYYALQKGASKVYACEPAPQSFQILVNHFGNHKNVILSNYGILEKEGTVNLIYSALEDTSGGNFLEANEKAVREHIGTLFSSKVEVLVKSFGTFIKENNITWIDYLKVDCEGGEYDIFIEKYLNFFINHVRKITLEFHDDSERITDLFEGHNFSIEKRNIGVGLLHITNLNI
jgi:FkbM family methyltransferase